MTPVWLRPAGRRACGLAVVAAALVTGATSPSLAAQAPPPTVLMGDASRRDVRVPEDQPNISGTWYNLTSDRNMNPADGGTTPFQPWARQLFEARGAAERSGRPQFDSVADCFTPGLPRMHAVPFTFEIVQTPDKIIILSEIMHAFRIIHMDGKPMPADYKPSDFGYSAGRWEGDTLVVETKGLNGLSPVDIEGRVKTSSMRIVEYIRKVAPNQLETSYTLFDPVTYTKPWTIRGKLAWRPDLRVPEYICEENNRNKPDASGRVQGNRG